MTKDPADRPTRNGALCGAKKRQGEGTCTQRAGWGTSHPGWGHCKLHGGASAPGNAHAASEAAYSAARTLGIPVEVDPAQALLGEVQRTAGVVAWLDRVVGDLDRAEVTYGVRYERWTPGEQGGRGTEEGPGVNEWVKLWQAERRHLAAVCKAALDAGVQERQVQLAEEQGEMAGRVVQAVLDELNLGRDDRERAIGAMRRQFDVLRGGAA